MNILKKKKKKLENYLTTAFLVFCLIGFSLEAHRGGTMSLRVFFSLSTLVLAERNFNSAADLFSQYESGLEGWDWCRWCTLW